MCLKCMCTLGAVISKCGAVSCYPFEKQLSEEVSSAVAL